MKITYDNSVDAAYIYLSTDKSSSSIPVEWVDGMLNIDFSSDWKIVWIEVIPASKFLSEKVLKQANVV